MYTYFDIQKMVEELEEAKDKILFLQTILGQNAVYIEGGTLQLDDCALSGLRHTLFSIIESVSKAGGCIVGNDDNSNGDGNSNEYCNDNSNNTETAEEAIQ